MENKRKRMKQAFEFFFTHTAHIDVVRNNKLELVYFILLPYSKALPKDKKTAFHEVVDRSNVKSKVSDLVGKIFFFLNFNKKKAISGHYIEVCKHEERLDIFFSKNKMLSLFAKYDKLWKDLAFIFTIMLNFFILLSYSTVFGDRMEEPRLFMMDGITKEETMNIIFYFGIIMTICSLFVVSFFVMKNLPLIIKRVIFF